jgi:Gas vesicle synthesis protein GvpL/GvpF
MASTYVYGVGRATAAAPSCRGLADAPLDVVRHGELAAIVSAIPSSTVRARRQDLLRHTDVLQAAFDRGTVVPMRFGTVFPSGDDLVADLLAPRHDALVGLLERFGGLAELTVRAFFLEQPVLAEIVREDREVARLRGGADRLRLGEAVAAALASKRGREAEAIVSRLVRHARDVVIEERQAELEVMRAAFLVERRAIEKFDVAMNEMARERDGVVRFKYTGPLPPHHFVDERWDS